MTKHEYSPLYCIISESGGMFSIQYETGNDSRASREGYSLETFEGLADQTPVIDHRTGDGSKIIRFIFANDTPTEGAQVADYLKRYSEATGSRIVSLKELRA